MLSPSSLYNAFIVALSLVLWVGVVFVTPVLYAETQDKNQTNLDNVGVNPVPVIILPGLLDQAQGEEDRTYPLYDRTLENPTLDLNRKGLLESPKSLTKPSSKPVASAVTVVASDFFEKKVFKDPKVTSDVYVFSDVTPIAKLSINGQPVKIQPGVLVQTLSSLTLKKGENKILIEGELQDRTPFSRIYTLYYADPPSLNRGFIYGSLAYGTESNPRSALDKSLANGISGSYYTGKAKADSFLFGTLSYTYRFFSGTDFTLGALATQYNASANKDLNSTTGFGNLNYQYKAFLPYVSGNYTSYKISSGNLTAYNAGIMYDFLYQGAAYYARVNNRLALDLNAGRTSATGYNGSNYYGGLHLEINTVKKIFSYFTSDLDSGVSTAGNLSYKYNYWRTTNTALWDKGRYNFYLGLDYTQNKYTDAYAINSSTDKRTDKITTYRAGGAWTLYAPFAITLDLRRFVDKSNFAPLQDDVAQLGISFQY